MITNLCPYAGNEQWCPNPGNTNNYGYSYHFDLIDPNMAGWVDSLGWNNPVVTFKRVACGGGGSPTCSEASQCECNSQSNMQSNCAGSSGSATSTSTSTSTHATSTSTSTSTSTHATSTSTSTSTHATSTSASSSTSTHSTSTSSTGTSGCHGSVSAALTQSWSGGGNVAITFTNTGSSAIHAVDIAISGSPSTFNLANLSSGHYNLASYAFPVNAGGTFTGGGFTFSGSQPSVSLSSVTC
eukprot:TRINITY_DN8111_c0_g2_i1.p1 TRINITY_DN8111_c0_g2~~TRINITY_DN8111_c0_g2_i1.p1  ORF type:complete len:241 (-),score=48.77 TRINITY_DN8111_c0_g2_i1:146-868(-)